MIVKVQVPISGNYTIPHALIYNEDKTIIFQTPVNKKLRKQMNGEVKRYFHAHMEGTELHIDSAAPWQEW